jgi:hypothetical protein
LHDLASRWVVTHSIAQWQNEIPWMSLYFSVAVWTSVLLGGWPWFAIACRATAWAGRCSNSPDAVRSLSWSVPRDEGGDSLSLKLAVLQG